MGNKFTNITPATFENSLTYIQQVKVLKDKINEIVEVVNEVLNKEGTQND